VRETVGVIVGVTEIVGVTAGVRVGVNEIVGVTGIVGVTVGVADGSGDGGGHGDPPVQPATDIHVPEEVSVISLFARSNIRILSPTLFQIFTLLHIN
jgi:hypothetical protein